MHGENRQGTGRRRAYPHVVINTMRKDVRGPISVTMLVEAIPAKRTEPVVRRRRLEMSAVMR